MARPYVNPNTRNRLPADLREKPLFIPTSGSPGGGMPGGGGPDLLTDIDTNINILTAALRIGRAFVARPVNVLTSAIQVVDGKFARAYIFQNPTPAMSLTGSGAVLASLAVAAGGSGNTEANAIGVSSFLDMTLFLNITAGTSTVTINALSQDPVSLNWVITQVAFNAIATGVGTYYASLGQLGIDKAFAISYSVGAVGTGATFSIGYVLKNGLPGGTTGLANAIYLGSAGVTTTSGFPLLEGKTATFYFDTNVQIYAISNAAAGVTLNVFELQ